MRSLFIITFLLLRLVEDSRETASIPRAVHPVSLERRFFAVEVDEDFLGISSLALRSQWTTVTLAISREISPITRNSQRRE